jgi:hypothetical protein
MLIAMRIRNMAMTATKSFIIAPITISIMLIVELPAWLKLYAPQLLMGKQRPRYQGTHTSSL